MTPSVAFRAPSPGSFAGGSYGNPGTRNGGNFDARKIGLHSGRWRTGLRAVIHEVGRSSPQGAFGSDFVTGPGMVTYRIINRK